MKRHKSKTTFWITLATIHVLSLIYPIYFIHKTKSVDESVFAVFALIGVVFLLVAIDVTALRCDAELSADNCPGTYIANRCTCWSPSRVAQQRQLTGIR